MKTLAHRLWFLLFAGIGTALLSLLLLLYGTAPVLIAGAIPLRYLLLGPAVAGAFLFAGIVAVADWLSPGVNETYLFSVKNRLQSQSSLFWAGLKISGSLVLLASADILWAGITFYYSADGSLERLNVFSDRFGLLLGLVNLLLVIKIFVIYAYQTSLPRWQVAAAEGMVSLAMAVTLAAIIVTAPFGGILPFLLLLAQKLIVDVFFFLQAMDAIARISRAAEFRQAEVVEEPHVTVIVHRTD